MNLVLDSKIFADDTNAFASAGDLKTLEDLMNPELAKVKKTGVILTSCQSIWAKQTLIKFYILNLIA